MKKDIKKLVLKLTKKFDTNNPEIIANSLGIEIITHNLGSTWGMYRNIKRNKFIFVNNKLSDNERKFVLAHELGHAIMHSKNNCFYLKHNTFMKVSNFEIEANKFAAELLISDNDIKDATERHFNIDQMGAYFEVPKDILEYKFNNLNKKRE